MPSRIKQHLRRRLLGNRNSHRLEYVDAAIGHLGNRHYLERYPELLAPGFEPGINAYEFAHHSQNGEDGIILHLLRKAGPGPRFIIEIGTEDARQCNSANLILNFGWSGLLIEADALWAEKARAYLAQSHAGDRARVLHATAAPDNINSLLADNGADAGADILSIDIDSYDYWLWESIEFCSPPLVIIEYNASFGPSLSVTVPPPGQARAGDFREPAYHGASINALERLGRRKGYCLVGGDSRGVNAFFVRQDVADQCGLQPVSPERAWRSHWRRGQRRNPAQQQQAATRLPLVTID